MNKKPELRLALRSQIKLTKSNTRFSENSSPKVFGILTRPKEDLIRILKMSMTATSILKSRSSEMITLTMIKKILTGMLKRLESEAMKMRRMKVNTRFIRKHQKCDHTTMVLLLKRMINLLAEALPQLPIGEP